MGLISASIRLTELLLVPVMVNSLQTTIQIQIEGLDWNKDVKASAVKTKYHYNNESCNFTGRFSIAVHSLHDFLFGKVEIVFSTEDSFECAFISILLKDFYNSKMRECQKREYPLLSACEMHTADYYGRKYKVLGKAKISLFKRELDKKFETKTDGVIQSFMPKIFQESTIVQLKNINNVFSILFQGSHMCRIKTITGILLNEYLSDKRYLYNSNTGNISGLPEDSGDLVEDYDNMDVKTAEALKINLKYVIASFLDSIVMKYTAGGRKKIVECKDEAKKSVLEVVEINEDDIYKVYRGSIDCIGFVILFDVDKAVVSFRGTLTSEDIIHDLNCCYIPFLNGYAHCGILKLASYFYNTEWKDLKVVLQQKKIKNVLFTGHSLGAAVGILLHIMISENEEDSRMFNIETSGFAPPPTVSMEIASRKLKNLRIYIFGKDSVTRMSLGSLKEYNYISLTLASKLSIRKGIDSVYEDYIEVKNYLSKTNLFPKLYHPGEIFHFEFKSDDCSAYQVKKRSPSYFSDFLGLKGFPRDHMPNVFFDALNYFISR